MSDDEWDRLREEVAGPRAEPIELVFDPRCSESADGPTPSGGAYSVAFYYNDDGPCPKAEATRVNIIEFSEDGRRINETYALLCDDAERL